MAFDVRRLWRKSVVRVCSKSLRIINKTVISPRPETHHDDRCGDYQAREGLPKVLSKRGEIILSTDELTKS